MFAVTTLQIETGGDKVHVHFSYSFNISFFIRAAVVTYSLNVGVDFGAIDIKWSFNELSLEYRASPVVQSLLKDKGFSTGTVATWTIDTAQCAPERRVLNTQYYLCFKDAKSACLPPIPWGVYTASKGEQNGSTSSPSASAVDHNFAVSAALAIAMKVILIVMYAFPI